MCWDFLGVKSTDAFYTIARVDSMLTIAEHQIAEEIRKQAPDILRMTIALKGDTLTAATYSFALQTPPITDFSEVLSIRLTDRDGPLLSRISDALIDEFVGLVYSLVGQDSAPVITIGRDVSLGQTLFLKYARKTGDWSAPNASPESVPDDYHDVVAFMATELLVGLGGEAQMPPTLAKYALDRRGQLWHHLGTRSPDAQRVPNEAFTRVIEAVRR